ncbi:Fic family protein [Polynucleobacter sp. 30F-ANTBAC]|uniref:Fic family protein n=1 Tax=Polynucleobacter sp. 30F-ANTBAC TaxID=2689095 RepID=UPI001C0B11D1|nr:Fic family protein [Polynucleobacter sp. 30F-ANTBAC]MBU3599736.1 Fic family protein [Polynucleobacter sp. 30F-ANTBAC]
MKYGEYTYIWQLNDWPNWQFNTSILADKIAEIHHARGYLLGHIDRLGFNLKQEAYLEIISDDVLKTSQIEGELLNQDAVRSSVAKHIGVDIGALPNRDRHIDGVVEMILDATQPNNDQLTKEKLLTWHEGLFPEQSLLNPIEIGAWRKDSKGPMQVISGPISKSKVHYQAPPAQIIDEEIGRFINWFNQESWLDPLIKAGIAHLWFVTIHPFDDGNGRIARAIGDMALAKAEKLNLRFYSLSAQIQKERETYYVQLEKTQKGSLHIDEWLDWFLSCLLRSIQASQATLQHVVGKAEFWQKNGGQALNPRQIKIINKLIDGFDGKLTSSKWAVINKCSTDTSLRDIQELILLGILKKTESGGRSTSYELIID